MWIGAIPAKPFWISEFSPSLLAATKEERGALSARRCDQRQVVVIPDRRLTKALNEQNGDNSHSPATPRTMVRLFGALALIGTLRQL
jgi:hypothetical protein